VVDEYSPKRQGSTKKPSARLVVYVQHINYEHVKPQRRAGVTLLSHAVTGINHFAIVRDDASCL